MVSGRLYTKPTSHITFQFQDKFASTLITLLPSQKPWNKQEKEKMNSTLNRHSILHFLSVEWKNGFASEISASIWFAKQSSLRCGFIANKQKKEWQKLVHKFVCFTNQFRWMYRRRRRRLSPTKDSSHPPTHPLFYNFTFFNYSFHGFYACLCLRVCFPAWVCLCPCSFVKKHTTNFTCHSLIRNFCCFFLCEHFFIWNSILLL